jgi:hypothetical protein
VVANKYVDGRGSAILRKVMHRGESEKMKRWELVSGSVWGMG